MYPRYSAPRASFALLSELGLTDRSRHRRPSDTPIVVLPPRSRYVPSRPNSKPVHAAWQTVDDSSGDFLHAGNVGNEEEGVVIEEIIQPIDEFRDGRPSSALPAKSPRGTAPSSPRHFRQPPGSGGSALLPAPGRPSVSQVRRGGGRPTSGAMQLYPRKGGGFRPGSAPGDPSAMQMHTLMTPGEELLHGPGLSTALAKTEPRGGRRPAAEELQYELSVTATVLRAAQDRLAKEREQRQLARVGEELALVDVARAREEAAQLAAERRESEREVAKRIAEQRSALEGELRRLEIENDVRAHPA